MDPLWILVIAVAGLWFTALVTAFIHFIISLWKILQGDSSYDFRFGISMVALVFLLLIFVWIFHTSYWI